VAVIVEAGSFEQRVTEFTVTVGAAFTVRVPDPFAEQVLPSVMVTLYVPATVALKLATFPGSLAPTGTVHTYV
jgi:hypothetical protein